MAAFIGVLVGWIAAFFLLPVLYAAALKRNMGLRAGTTDSPPLKVTHGRGEGSGQLVLARVEDLAPVRPRSRRTLIYLALVVISALSSSAILQLVLEPNASGVYRITPLSLMVGAAIYTSVPFVIGRVLSGLRGTMSNFGSWTLPSFLFGALPGGALSFSMAEPVSRMPVIGLSVRVLHVILALAVGYGLLLTFIAARSVLARLIPLSADSKVLVSSLLSGGIALSLYNTGASNARGLVLMLPWIGAALVLVLVLIATAPRLERRAGILFLRAFRKPKQSNRITRHFARNFNEHGPLHFIAGPDLATTAVDLAAALSWLLGRAKSRFIRSTAEASLRVNAAMLPRRDGRFDVSELACFDDTWRDVVALLAERVDGVIIDLRGYDQGSAELSWELELMLSKVPLDRLILLTDAQTDRELLVRAIGPMTVTAYQLSSTSNRELDAVVERARRLVVSPRRTSEAVG
ncbi:hypothetical protein JY651_14095 [Pyxidicoccus parkwayensis]|uniref:Uncharacterized protein n=1 Tax=Pyxidicoccus parkwayensis TaxID=2813578 RepID=A0ABX7P6A3_9BACT|nr:hypothetical protein [Pyxidicoccus parkwaysis]QSQ25982.1 hypothetical protein JY651_14095 [Pyxidicoccus parkwaysis]